MKKKKENFEIEVIDNKVFIKSKKTGKAIFFVDTKDHGGSITKALDHVFDILHDANKIMKDYSSK